MAPAEASAEVLLRPPDRKDVLRLDTYNGNTDHWLKWSNGFKKFVEKLKDKPVAEADEAKCAKGVGLGPIC